MLVDSEIFWKDIGFSFYLIVSRYVICFANSYKDFVCLLNIRCLGNCGKECWMLKAKGRRHEETSFGSKRRQQFSPVLLLLPQFSVLPRSSQTPLWEVVR